MVVKEGSRNWHLIPAQLVLNAGGVSRTGFCLQSSD